MYTMCTVALLFSLYPFVGRISLFLSAAAVQASVKNLSTSFIWRLTERETQTHHCGEFSFEARTQRGRLERRERCPRFSCNDLPLFPRSATGAGCDCKHTRRILSSLRGLFARPLIRHNATAAVHLTASKDKLFLSLFAFCVPLLGAYTPPLPPHPDLFVLIVSPFVSTAAGSRKVRPALLHTSTTRASWTLAQLVGSGLTTTKSDEGPRDVETVELLHINEVQR